MAFYENIKLCVATQPGSRPWRAGSRLHLEKKHAAVDILIVRDVWSVEY